MSINELKMIRLYHGSKSGLVGAIAPRSRDICDFGRGFYMGDERTQPLTLISHGESPRLYEIDFELDGLKVRRFSADLEWAMFVAWNRRVIPERFRDFYDARFRPVAAENDVLFGKIANDRMVVVLEWFFSGFISDVGLLRSLQALNLGSQYCAVTSKACERVKIVSEKRLSVKEGQELAIKSQNQRAVAVKMVDRIRLENRRDGRTFMEIIESQTGRPWYDA